MSFFRPRLSIISALDAVCVVPVSDAPAQKDRLTVERERLANNRFIIPFSIKHMPNMVTLKIMKEATASAPQPLLVPSARRQEHVWGESLVLLPEHPLSAAARSREKILEEVDHVG